MPFPSVTRQNLIPQKILQNIGQTIRTFDPDYVMVSSFARDICESYYASEERLQLILLFGSIFSIFIVLLGIYALVSHNMLSRTKEIGIRKVMGGSDTANDDPDLRFHT